MTNIVNNMTTNSYNDSQTAAEILNAFNHAIDMEQVSFVFAPGTKFSVNTKIFTLDYWMERRKDERKLSTSVNWPENLSKKEKVICKLKLIRSLLEHAEVEPVSDHFVAKELHKYLIMILDRQILEIFKYQKNHPGEIWKGLAADSAKFLNTLHTKLNSSYKTYLSNTYEKRN